MKDYLNEALSADAQNDRDENEMTDQNERRAALAEVETDDTSLALAWIAAEGGRCDEEDPEILRASDGSKGLGIPQSITDAKQTYFEEEDIVRQFLMEAQSCSQSSVDWCLGAFVSCSALLDEFNRWGVRNGHRPWSVRALSKAIRENAMRYGLSDVRTNVARGFQVERRLAGPPTGGEERPGKNARQAAIRYLRAVDDGRKIGD
jgi:hypothetical protein